MRRSSSWRGTSWAARSGAATSCTSGTTWAPRRSTGCSRTACTPSPPAAAATSSSTRSSPRHAADLTERRRCRRRAARRCRAARVDRTPRAGSASEGVGVRRVTLRCVGVVPHGTVTFLFTDVEGSTRLWEQDGEAMRLALAAHDRIVRSAIEEHDGYVFSTAGDAFSAAFSTPAEAVGAAVEAQRRLGAEDWPVGVRVRMGVHSGTAEERDGDYFGPAVNRAARVMSAGHGGQVLVSLATEELVRDRLPDGVSFVDLGEHALVGLARPERLFQVAASGLVSSFPPLADRCVPGRQPGPVGDEFRGPRRGPGAAGGGVADAADGHADRGRWGGQDPTGDGGGPGGGGGVSPTGCGCASWPRWRMAMRWRTRWRRRWRCAARRACRCWTAWWTP